jgi:hypothetical protein
MPRVSYAFFSFAALCGLIGTIWGEHMGRTDNHATFVGHAHLNLVGWVSMAVMGGFYALAAGTYPRWLAWTNFVLQALAAVCLAIAMVYLMAFVDRRFIPLAIIGSASAIFSMVAFLAAVLVSWRNSARSQA